MASLGMEGPYPLSVAEIARRVTRTSAGNYGLSRSSQGDFFVHYVGRSDTDVADRLRKWAEQASYRRFKFSYATSPKAAFDRECQTYHDFDGPKGALDNKQHPDRPSGSGWRCPRCSVFG